VKKGDIIIILSPRPIRGFAAVVDEVTPEGCMAHLLDSEDLPRPFSGNEFMTTRQTTESILTKYERTSLELDEALTLERDFPDFFTKKPKVKAKAKSKTPAKKKELTKAQLRMLGQVVKALLKEKGEPK